MADEEAGDTGRLLPAVAALCSDASPSAHSRVSVSFRQEASRLLALAWPISLLNLLNFVGGIVPLAFVGHLDPFSLSVAVLATSFFNVSGYCIILGTAAALETLCGQAYGAKQYQLLGQQLQRGLLISCIVVLLICGVWTQLHPLLLLLGQNEEIAAAAARYVWLCVPALPFIAGTECIRRYLLAQNCVLPSMVACLATTLLAPLYAWPLVFHSGLRVYGAAAAFGLISATNAALLAGYVVARERRLAGTPQQTWHGWSRECWRGWGAYLRIAVPSVTMTAGELWAFEATILLAGMLPDPQTAVDIMGIAHVLSSGLFMVPLGLSGAVSARVANELGAGDGLRARGAARASAVLVVAVMLVFSAGVLAVRHVYGWVFSNNAVVVATLARVLVFVAVASVGDGVNAVQSGVVRGAGRQNWAAATNLLVYWVLGVPLAVWLAFRLRLGVFGLWGGLVFITCLQGTVMTVLVLFFDWRAEAARACQLLGGSAAPGGKAAPPEGLELVPERGGRELRQGSEGSGEDDEGAVLLEAVPGALEPGPSAQGRWVLTGGGVV